MLHKTSQKDIEYIHFAVDQKLDFIAHSFVRNKEDALAVQRILDKRGSDIKIIAKIENQDGVDNIDEILDHVYGIMIARGDLALELSPEEVPLLQKRIIAFNAIITQEDMIPTTVKKDLEIIIGKHLKG